MKKYLRYSCSVCNRFADRLVDNVRAMPDKCTITFKCEGRLYPVQYRSNGGITSIPEVGVTDWRARGQSISILSQDEVTKLLDTSTGTSQQVVLAVLSPTSIPSSSTLKLTLNQRSDAPKKYKAYVYRLDTSFSTISGVESNLEKKTLRYSETDTVEVFVNGIKQELGPIGTGTYQIYNGVAPVPPNTIVFNPIIALPGITQVDVIVSAASAINQSTVTFNRNIDDESRLKTGSWENVDYVERYNGSIWQKWYLFTLDLIDASELILNTIMTSSQSIVINDVGIVPINDVMMLLARKPYSALDRYSNIVIPLSTLTFERDFLKYFVVDGKAVLHITESAKEIVYPPLRAIKFNIEKTIQTKLAGVTDQYIVDGSVIVGPDA